MKARTIEELVDFLAEQRKRRKHELISMRGRIVPNALAPNSADLRASVVFSYAHWEGFVKMAAQAYITYATHKSRPLIQLNRAFRALSCREILISAALASKRIHPHLEVVDQLTERLHTSRPIDPSKAIDTESNLTSEVFHNICTSIGIDYEKTWLSYAPFMDDMFLVRCAIAHGELSCPTNNHALESIDFAVTSIDKLSTQIENAAATRDFIHQHYRSIRSI